MPKYKLYRDVRPDPEQRPRPKLYAIKRLDTGLLFGGYHGSHRDVAPRLIWVSLDGAFEGDRICLYPKPDTQNLLELDRFITSVTSYVEVTITDLIG